MPDAIKWRSKIILAKLETSYGVDANPTGAANAILMTDVTFSPMEGEDVSRNLERPYLGANEEFKTALRYVLTGSTELAGSGTAGTAPAWGALARACGLAEVVTPNTSVEYVPVSQQHESATIHFWIGGTRHVMRGCRGTAVIAINAQGIPVIRWTLTGLWTQPGEQARPTPDFSAWQKPLIATDANTPTFTLGGTSLVLRSFEFSLGNDVQPRLLINREEIMIVDRAEEIAATVEAVPLTTFDPFDHAVDMTTIPLALTHGTAAGNIVAITAPKCSVRRPTGYENQQGVLEWPLRLTPLPTVGDDQFTLTLT
jgi:hypothetical protein